MIVGLTSAVKRHPAIGWVRADKVPAESTVAEILKLRNRIAELEQSAEADKTHAPEGTEDLMRGDDKIEIHFDFIATPGYPHDGNKFSATHRLSWNEIFGAIAPRMINECSEFDLRLAFSSAFEKRAREALSDEKQLADLELRSFKFLDDEMETCVLQFRALGLIVRSERARSVKDTSTYWTLTPYGDYLMTQLRALRRTPASRSATKGNVETE